ncbi:MAG: hypothetical protein AABX70_06975 [Nanoarchaeota archaeon]
MTKIYWERLKYPWSKSEDPVRFWLSMGGLFLFVFSFAVLHSISADLGLTRNTGGLAILPPGYNPNSFQQGAYGGYPNYYDPNSPSSNGQYFGSRPQDYYSQQQYGYYQQGQQGPIYYGNNQYGGAPGYGGGYNQYPGYGQPGYGAPGGYGQQYGAQGGYGSQYGGYGPSPYYNPGNVPVFRAVKTPSEAQTPQQTLVENQVSTQELPETQLPQQPSEIKIERTSVPPPPTAFEPSQPPTSSKKLSNTFLYIILVFAILIWLYLIYFMFKPKPHPHAPSKPAGFESSDLAQLEFHKPTVVMVHSKPKVAPKKKKR